jgi:hypothetical protein
MKCFQCFSISIVFDDHTNFMKFKLQNMNMSCKLHGPLQICTFKYYIPRNKTCLYMALLHPLLLSKMPSQEHTKLNICMGPNLKISVARHYVQSCHCFHLYFMYCVLNVGLWWQLFTTLCISNIVTQVYWISKWIVVDKMTYHGKSDTVH